MQAIEGSAKTIKQLLQGSRYSVDSYQREYAWQTRQITDLIDDLSAKFLDSCDEGHDWQDVEHYGHYFLGAIASFNLDIPDREDLMTRLLRGEEVCGVSHSESTRNLAARYQDILENFPDKLKDVALEKDCP